MRKANNLEHVKITNLLKRKIQQEKIENGFGFGMAFFMLGVILACIFQDTTGKLSQFTPLFVGVGIFMFVLLGYLVVMIYRRFNIYSKRLNNQEYQVENCIVEEFDLKLYPKSQQATYFAKITDMQGNVIENNCEILNKIEFKTLDKFVNRHKNRECLYIKVGDNFKFVLISEEELATN